MRAAQARVAPHLPPLMAQGLWIARLNGDYDPPNGKYSVPAWGVYQPDEQLDFPGSSTFAPSGPQSSEPMPDMSAVLQNPFVRAVLASSSARRGGASPFAPQGGFGNYDEMPRQTVPRTSDQDQAASYPSATPVGYGDDGSGSGGGPFGGVLTPVARVPTPGMHTKDHNPDSVLGSGDPLHEIHPPWSQYDREELPGDRLVPAFGIWHTKEPGWEYSSDGGRTWKPLHSDDEDASVPKPPDLFKLQPNENDNPKGYIFRFTGV